MALEQERGQSDALYDLELFQRDVLGLIYEEMDFSEASLARALRFYIDSLQIQTDDIAMLNVFADALDNRSAIWKLELRGHRPGPRQLLYNQSVRYKSNFALYLEVKLRLEEGLQPKAAISLAAEKFGVSRPTVYRRLREHELEIKRVDAAVQKFSLTLRD